MNAVLRPAGYQDILDLPEHVTGEIIDGQLHKQARPSSRHARVELGIGRELSGPFDLGRGGPGGWVILVEPELQLQAQVLVPDLAGWRRERLPLIPDGPVDVVPDWICEILSPGTANRDRRIKLPLYGQLGVRHAWIVDPAVRTIEVMRFEAPHWLLLATHGDDDVMRAEPFDAVGIELASFWAW